MGAQDVILRVSNVLFPMFKTFTEQDMKAAKITIVSKYDPVSSWTDPTYVVKVYRDMTLLYTNPLIGPVK